MHDPTRVNIIDGLEKLVHDERNLIIREWKLLLVVEQIATLDLLHHYVDVLISFEGLFHLNHVWMWDLLQDLYFFPQETVGLLIFQGLFLNYFNGHDFASYLVFALVDNWKFAFANFTTSQICIVEVAVFGLGLQDFEPVIDDLLISMV